MKEGLIELFIEKRAKLIFDEPDRIDINGLKFHDVDEVRIIQRTASLELIHNESIQEFNLEDIKEIVFYKWHDPEFSERGWEELFRYPKRR